MVLLEEGIGEIRNKMITPEQEKWLAHLDDSDAVKIIPADLRAKEKFEKIKSTIKSALGENENVVHKGATSLGISGQGELDIYILVLSENFDSMVQAVEKLFGKPRSLYPLERARFVASVDDTKAEVFVINENTKSWKDGCVFEKYLRKNPEVLEAYKILKEEGNGLSTQKYYRRKIEFMNEILDKAKSK